MPASPVPPAVLTFAATDPTSGAGLQADILTLASMGCHPLSVVTAITVQDTAGVEGFLALDPDWVADQARCILEDIPVVAFKVGVLGSSEIVTVVAEVVSDYPDIPLVLDPVLASGRGDEFGGEDMVSAIRELLVPQSTVVTPNIPELRRLAEVDEDEDPDHAECARRLLDVGCEYVLVTGTHDSTASVVNTLYHRGRHRPHRHLAAPAGQLPRLRLHARLGHRRQPRARARGRRGRPRSPGLHVAGALPRLPARHGPVHPRSPLLGAG